MATAASSPSTNDHGTVREDQSNPTPGLEQDMQQLALEEHAADDVTDTDYMPTSADESDSRSKKDDSEDGDAAEQPTEHHTPLDFQIPEDILRAAMTAPENTKASFWSSNLYRGSEDKKILVHYCRTKEVAERVAQHFVGEQVVGFDIEWKPWAHPLSIKKNVSLIQLACENRIALFHVALFTEQTAAQLMPPTLKAILESPDVYKVGVAVKGDFSRLVKFLDVEPQGVFELSRLHNLVEFSVTDPSKVTNKLVGLAAQVQRHLQLPLYKGGQLVDDPDDTYNVRSSDWSLPLNHLQIHYAAADAYAGFRLYDALEEKRKHLKPTPPRPLLCDYDSKPKPKSSDSKPRKKRKAATKTDEASSPVEEEVSASAEAEHVQGEPLEAEAKQSQDTEGYQTAQEDLLDSHQLEGEDSAPSGQSYESTDESEENTSFELSPSPEQEGKATPAAPNQRRVGRVNLSWLKGPDPGYPTLPKFPIGEHPSASSDEDLVDMSGDSDGSSPYQIIKPAEASQTDGESDEFDDSELEEALQVLDIDSNGSVKNATVEHSTPPEGQSWSVETPEEMLPLSESEIESNKPDEAAASELTANSSTPDQEEQQLLDLLNDSAVIDYLHTTDEPTSSPSSHIPPSTDLPTSPHTPEYDRATVWAQSYLASTMPSPTSHTPSHIRATIPHLRAYNMWHHQGLCLGEVARHLREPPLAESTVGSYVLQAITLERMEFDEEKVRGVLMGMPEALRRGKWRTLAEKVGAR